VCSSDLYVGRKGKGDKNTGTYGKELFSFDNIVAKRYDPSALPRGYGVWQFDPDGNPIPQILVYDKEAFGGGVKQYIAESKWPSFKAELQDSLERQKKERKIAIKRYKNMGYSEKLAEQFAPKLTPSIPTTTASNQSPSSAIPAPPSRPSQSPMGRGSSTASNTLQTLMDRVGPINSPIKNQPSSVADDRPINITTGPVLEFDGKRYVTWTDFEKGLRDVKRQTLGEIRTAAGRRATGR
jgi:hypothetical protein